MVFRTFIVGQQGNEVNLAEGEITYNSTPHIEWPAQAQQLDAASHFCARSKVSGVRNYRVV